MEDILPRNWRALPFVVAAAQTAPMLAAMPSHEWLQSLWAFVGSEHRRCFSQWPSEGTCATKPCSNPLHHGCAPLALTRFGPTLPPSSTHIG